MIEKLEKKPFAKILQGPRILLQRADAKFAEPLWESILKDRTQRPLSWPGIESVNDLRDYLSQVGTDIPEGEVVYLLFKGNDVIGSLHLHTLSYGSHKTELGYAIEKNYEGQGYISEAVPLVEKELKELGFNRIEIRCNTDNLRSVRLAERNQYKHEGTMLQESVENGEYRDTAIFAKILK